MCECAQLEEEARDKRRVQEAHRLGRTSTLTRPSDRDWARMVQWGFASRVLVAVASSRSCLSLVSAKEAILAVPRSTHWRM